jgi:hypothetical protein
MEAREARVAAAASPQPAEKRPRRMVEITAFLAISLYWRRSGNLGVSGGTHAFVDSVRNGFGNFPA